MYTAPKFWYYKRTDDKKISRSYIIHKEISLLRLENIHVYEALARLAHSRIGLYLNNDYLFFQIRSLMQFLFCYTLKNCAKIA